MKKAVETGDVPHCIVPQCNGLVKPDIVFFGEQLPNSFFRIRNRVVPEKADLVIIMGTSLSVAPFSTLPQFASEGVPRVLFNLEPVGDIGSRPDDVIVLGDCDSGVRRLADALGWRDELEALWVEVGGNVKEKEAETLREQRKNMSKDEVLEAEIQELTAEVDAALNISQDHARRVNDEVMKNSKSPQASSSASVTDSETLSRGDAGSPEPASTPLLDGNTPINTEKVAPDVPVEAPKVNVNAILDVTLPQNRPN